MYVSRVICGNSVIMHIEPTMKTKKTLHKEKTHELNQKAATYHNLLNKLYRDLRVNLI